MNRLEQLKARLAQKQREESEKQSYNKNDYYPFWNMDFNTEVVMRILPDKNAENPDVYFVEKREHVLSINGEDKKMSCTQMYGEQCPICDLSQKYYKAAKVADEIENKTKGKYYYRKKRYLIQALIKKDPLAPDSDGERAEGKVKLIQISWEMMKTIKSQVENMIKDEIDPFDAEHGFDFIIRKAVKYGENKKQYADYSTSGFSRKESSLDEGVEAFDLSQFLPPNPTQDKLEKRLEAHLNGLDYVEDSEQKPEREVEHSVGNIAHEESKVEQVFTPTKDDKLAPTKESKKIETISVDDDGDDLLAAIRARRAQKAASAE